MAEQNCLDSRHRRLSQVRCWPPGAAPWFVPAHVLGAAGQTAPSDKITLGVIGVGAQGQYDMRNFLTHDDVRVTAICDVNQRNIAAATEHIAKAYGSPDVKVFPDFRELNADRLDRRGADGPARALAQHPGAGRHPARQAHLSRKADGHVVRGGRARARGGAGRRAWCFSSAPSSGPT